MNITKKLFLIGCLFFQLFDGLAQCDEKLVDLAIKNCGKDALFVREFTIKNMKERKKKVSNSATFDVRLNQGYIYRFYLENTPDAQGIAMLQLYDRNLLLGNTYNENTKQNEKTFDFLCSERKNYQVILSFVDDKNGCAAAVMGIVIKDTTNLATLASELPASNVLYSKVDNYLSIAASEAPAARLEVTISEGKITEDDGLYRVNVDKTGPVTIETTVRDSLGNIREMVRSNFMVQAALPGLNLQGSNGGLLMKEKLTGNQIQLQLENVQENNPYEMESFSIAQNLHEIGLKADKTLNLNVKQLNFLKSLKNGDTFYIKDIMVKNKEGQLFKLQPLGFIILDEN
jgi:hypothetical protein